MSRRYSNRGSHPLNLGKRHIERLADALEHLMASATWSYSHVPAPETKFQWNVGYQDKTKDTALTTAQVLALPNGRRKRIIALEIEARSGYSPNSVVIDGEDGAVWRAYAIGDGDEVDRFKFEVESIMADCRPWWSGIAWFNFGVLPYALLGFFMAGILVRVLWPPVPAHIHTPDHSTFYQIANSLLIAITSLSSVFLIITDRVLKRILFPPLVVEVGEGEKQGDHSKSVRRIVLPFFVSTCMGFFGWGQLIHPFGSPDDARPLPAQESGDLAQ